MTKKWRFTAWAIYTIGCFAIMLIGFDWKVAIPISLIIGFFAGLLNEIIHLLIKIHEEIISQKKY